MQGHPSDWIIVGEGLTILSVTEGGTCLDIFSQSCHVSFFPFLWKAVRCRLKHCLKGPLNLKQPTKQPSTSRDEMRMS